MSEQTDAELRAQIEELIRDEIQEGINEYLDEQEKNPPDEKSLGFANTEEEINELKVNILNSEVDKLLKEYKKIKRSQKSNFSEIKKLGLLDKNGRPL
tara:strand:- start:796 stop:1089 length:294 start_codon:yes stop_codon:yes gene_type:complete